MALAERINVISTYTDLDLRGDFSISSSLLLFPIITSAENISIYTFIKIDHKAGSEMILNIFI